MVTSEERSEVETADVLLTFTQALHGDRQLSFHLKKRLQLVHVVEQLPHSLVMVVMLSTGRFGPNGSTHSVPTGWDLCQDDWFRFPVAQPLGVCP